MPAKRSVRATNATGDYAQPGTSEPMYTLEGSGTGKNRHRSNIPASRYWHQGFGVVIRNGIPRVPFIDKATAMRIAKQAETNVPPKKGLKPKMTVFKDVDGWSYRLAKGEQ